MCEDDGKLKPRFFGDGESFGDGGAWVHLGDTPEQVADMVKQWAENTVLASSFPAEHQCEIKVSMMTDAQVEALPEI
jgi:hypothetical protein